MKQHRLRVCRVPPRHWLFREGECKRLDDVAERIGRVTGEIDERRIGTKSFATFLRENRNKFSADDAAIAGSFIEGFEAAPMAEMSARAVAGATLNDEEQFILPEGCHTLVAAMVETLPRSKTTLVLNQVVKSVRWRRGAVTVVTRDRRYDAAAAVSTLPLGVLQARRSQRGSVRFVPALGAKQKLISTLRVGHVIRLELRLAPQMARQLAARLNQRKKRGGFGFVHSRVKGVPVWWSLSDDSIFTGWAGGPAARALVGRSSRAIRAAALTSLGRIFGVAASALRRAVRGCQMHNWSRDPYARGAYSFVAAGADDGPARLRMPVQDTLFFAGEATADGEEIGTMHGALASGLRAAEEISARLGKQRSSKRENKKPAARSSRRGLKQKNGGRVPSPARAQGTR